MPGGRNSNSATRHGRSLISGPVRNKNQFGANSNCQREALRHASRMIFEETTSHLIFLSARALERAVALADFEVHPTN